MPPSLPTLHLSLRFTGADLFGTLEWTLANARRTGLSLHSLRVGQDARAPVSLSVCAQEADLLDLFVKRLANGMDVEVVDMVEMPGSAHEVHDVHEIALQAA